MLHRGLACLVLGALALSCSQEESKAEAPKDVKRADPDRIPAPHHSPEMLRTDPTKLRKVSTQGKLDADISGQRKHFDFFPPGANVAVHSEETGVSRINITAAENDSGFPRLSIVLQNVRLDELEFPATFTAAAPENERAPKLTVKLHRDESRWWENATQDEAAEQTTVTLTGFEGKTLRGKLDAVLQPRTEGMGEPARISGAEFETQLRLKGIKPGKTAQSGATQTAAQGEAEPQDSAPAASAPP